MNGRTLHLASALAALWARPLIRDTVVTTVLNLLGKGAGFLVPFFIAAWFGVSPETDAFFYAYAVVLFITGIVGPVVESVVVPFIAELRERGPAEVGSFVVSAIALSATVVGILGLLAAFALPGILGVAAAFDDYSADLIVRLYVEALPLVIFLVSTNILAGVLNAHRRFSIPALSPAVRAAFTLTFIVVLKDRLGIHAVPIGYVLGEVLRLSVLYWALRDRIDVRLSDRPISSPRLHEFMKAAFYQIVGMIALVANPIIDKSMASWLGPGKVSAIEYGERLYQVPLTLTTYGLFVVLLSHWSNQFYHGNRDLLRGQLVRAVKLVSVVGLSLSAGLFILKDRIVRLVYGYGDFPGSYLGEVGQVLGMYLLGLAPTLIAVMLIRFHVVQKATKPLMWLSFLNCSSHVALNFLLIETYGVSGLALSTSFSQTITCIGLWYSYSRIGGGTRGAGHS